MNLDGPEVDHNSYYLFPQRKHNSCGSHIRKATLSTKTLFCPIIPACPDPITMLQPALVKVASWSSGERPRRLLGSSSVVSPAGQGLQEQKGLRGNPQTRRHPMLQTPHTTCTCCSLPGRIAPVQCSCATCGSVSTAGVSAKLSALFYTSRD